MPLDIFLRTCSRVAAFNGVPRPLGASKSEVSIRCLLTLVEAVTSAIKQGSDKAIALTIIDDHSTDDFVETCHSILRKCSFPTILLPLTEASGNGASLHRTYHEARIKGSDLIYFVEDDYLHAPTAIQEMLAAYRLGRQAFDRDVAIFPCDYVDRYKRPEPSQVLLGESRYWRTITSTTGTFMITREILETYWPLYMRFAQYGIDPHVCEANSIDLVYREVPCLSPMPSLAVHLHEGYLSHFVDWSRWWHQTDAPRGRHITHSYAQNVPLSGR